VRADHAPLEGLEIDRALASERGMRRRQEHLAQAIALVGIVADRGDRVSGGGGELGERTRGQRSSSSSGSRRLPHWRSSRSEAGVKAA